MRLLETVKPTNSILVCCEGMLDMFYHYAVKLSFLDFEQVALCVKREDLYVRHK